MADLLTTPILVDPDDLTGVFDEVMQSYFPLWQPSEGDALTRIRSAFAAMVAENQTLATQALVELIEAFGTTQGLPPNPATAATGVSTWTLIDSAGYTIPSGTHVYLGAVDGTRVTFVVQADVIVAPGSSVTGAGEVVLVADEPGAAGSGLTGTVTVVDDLAFVDSAVMVGVTTGGQDAETSGDYLVRYAKFARLLAPRPILPADFALLVQVLHSEVDRALAIDGYNPTGPLTDQERCVTVIPIDSAGQPLPAPTKALIDADLQARREITFEVFVIDPTYTTLDVDFVGKSLDGYDPADVQARAIAAVTAFLNPASWGRPVAGDASVWLERDTLRYQDVITVLNNVEGFDYYTTLTVNTGTADVALAGPGALPLAGAITGAVTAP